MKLSVSSRPLCEGKGDAILLFFRGLRSLPAALPEALRNRRASLLETTSFKGEAGQVAVLPAGDEVRAKAYVFAGLGASDENLPGTLERAASAAVRAGRAAGLFRFLVPADAVPEGLSANEFRLLVGRGAQWGAYDFSRFKTDAPRRPAGSLVFAGGRDRSGLREAGIQGEALRAVADLANLPGNEATPERICAFAREMARHSGLSCRVLGPAALKKMGFGALLAVGGGSAREPRLIVLRHAGADPKAKPIVLVGKTVTFDAGGISIKPGKGMGWMRYDKCGGMAVLAAMRMIAETNAPAPVVGILAVAENMPDGGAARPGDVVRCRNGKTVEILNTDAEGRLLLADALAYASEMKPRAIVDVATLTGACVVALGSAASAVLGSDDALVEGLVSAGAADGERLWHLPLYREYLEEMKSDFADLSNLCKSGGAGTATAAAFLREFVGEGIPWAHIDIAGTAWMETEKPHQAPGATLFGARLLARWVARENG